MEDPYVYMVFWGPTGAAEHMPEPSRSFVMGNLFGSHPQMQSGRELQSAGPSTGLLLRNLGLR